MQIMQDILCFWLAVSGLSARRANALTERYSLTELWDELGSSLNDPALFGARAYDALLRYRNETLLAAELQKMEDAGVSFVPRTRFPEPLRQKEVDAPMVLYYRGDARLLYTDCVAVVGTRSCSTYGKEATKHIVAQLCENNVTVVSGLASGVDTYAHRATLKAGGKTIAVLGSGLNRVAPQSNLGLYEDILQSGGLIVSEYAPTVDATRYTFPERNRIISGLSKGTVVVEAGAKSGALITADYAAEQGRTVFAVPGTIFSKTSEGCNKLLYDGAVPALDGTHICETLGITVKESDKKPHVATLDFFEQKIYNILQSGEKAFDDIADMSEMPPNKLSALLLSMELKGLLRKKQSNIYAIV